MHTHPSFHPCTVPSIGGHTQCISSHHYCHPTRLPHGTLAAPLPGEVYHLRLQVEELGSEMFNKLAVPAGAGTGRCGGELGPGERPSKSCRAGCLPLLPLPPPPSQAHQPLSPRSVSCSQSGAGSGSPPQGAHGAPRSTGSPLSGGAAGGPATGLAVTIVRPQRPFVSHRLFLFAGPALPAQPQRFALWMGERLGASGESSGSESRDPKTSPPSLSFPTCEREDCPCQAHLHWRPW